MTELKFDRIEMEVANRLYGTFQNPVAEQLLQERCISAVAIGSICCTNLFDDININNLQIIKSDQVLAVLTNSGVLDLVTICINAEKEGKQ